MDEIQVIRDAASRFANMLRLYAETSLTTHSLYAVDPEEAIDNLDRTFDGLLASIHSLYDAMRGPIPELNWYSHGDTCSCLLVRNARHHNLQRLFPSWNCVMLKEGKLRQMAGASFLMVDYELVAQEGRTAKYYVPWDHFRQFVDLPSKTNRLREPRAVRALLDNDCGFDIVAGYASDHGFPRDQIFMNMIPLVMAVATRSFGALRDRGITASGFDSNTYCDHFAAAPLVNLGAPTFGVVLAPLSLEE